MPPTKTINRTLPPQDFTVGLHSQTIDNTAALKRFDYVRLELNRVTWPGYSTIAVAAGASDTQITIGDGSQFFAPSEIAFETAAGDVELGQVTAINGNVLTVVRGQRGLPAIDLPVGTHVTTVRVAEVTFYRIPQSPPGPPERIGSATFGGHQDINQVMYVEFRWSKPNIGPFAKNGDVRVDLEVFGLPIRTGFTLEGGTT